MEHAVSNPRRSGQSFFQWVVALLILSLSTSAQADRGQFENGGRSGNDSSACQWIIDNSRPTETLSELILRARKKIDVAWAEEPPPNHGLITDERKVKDTGDLPPRSMRDTLPASIQLVRTPSTTAEHPMVADHVKPYLGSTYYLGYEWNGSETSTRVYVSLPAKTEPPESGQFLISDQYETALYHIHGGGTPSAKAANASSVAEPLSKYDIPLIAVDQPGHGYGTNAPMSSSLEWVMMNLEIMKKTIDPRVEVVISGHSWGGEFGILLNLFIAQGKIRAVDPADVANLKRIKGIVALSPPADISMGASAEERMRMEKEFESVFKDLEHLVAPSDRDFVNNVVASGKVSLRALWYTTMTMLDYAWTTLPEAQQSRLLPMITMIGTADFLYVGREKQFEEFHANLGDTVSLVTIGERETFKTVKQELGPQPTGHQTMDAYMVHTEGSGKDGDPEREVFVRMAEFIGALKGKKLEKKDREGNPSNPWVLYSRIRQFIANNFAAREFFATDKQNVRVAKEGISGYAKENEELLKILNRKDRILTEHRIFETKDLAQAQRNYDSSYGVRGGIKAARKELELMDQPERKEELEAAIDRAEEITRNFPGRFSSQAHDDEIQKLLSRYDFDFVDSVMAGKSHMDGLRAIVTHIDELMPRYQKFEDLDRIAGQIRGYHSIFSRGDMTEEVRDTSIQEAIDKVKKYGVSSEDEIDAAIQEIRDFFGRTQNQIREEKKKLASFRQSTQQLIKDLGHEYAAALDQALIDEAGFPDGVRSIKDARWELGLERSSERREKLEEYIQGHPRVAEEHQLRMEERLRSRLAEIELPEGLADIQAVSNRARYINSVMSGTAVASGENEEMSARLVDEIKKLNEELEELQKSLKQADGKLSKLKGQKDKLLRHLDEALSQAESERMKATLELVQKDLDEFVSAYQAAEKSAENYILYHQMVGSLNHEALTHIPEEIEHQHRAFVTRREAYFGRLRELHAVQVEEGFAGNLRVPEDFRYRDSSERRSIQELYNDLLGAEYVNLPREQRQATPDSLEGRILILERRVELIQSVINQKQRQLSETQRDYYNTFKDPETGENQFYEYVEVDIKELLDRPFDDLWYQMTDGPDSQVIVKALQGSLQSWQSKWNRVLRDTEVKDSSELY